MRWCGMRSAFTDILNLSRPPFIKRPTNIVGSRDISIIVIIFRIHLITHRTRHHHFRSHKSCLCSIYVLLYLALFWLLLVFFRLKFFIWQPLAFVTHPHLPIPARLHPASLFVLPPFCPAKSVGLWLFFLDAVSHRMFHLFLALGFDEIEWACVW